MVSFTGILLDVLSQCKVKKDLENLRVWLAVTDVHEVENIQCHKLNKMIDPKHGSQ